MAFQGATFQHFTSTIGIGLVAVAFIDFKKAFDSVSHAILETKLERDFAISGPLLDWLKRYLKERQQFTDVNGSTSEMTLISFGIPQGSVLGPTLFTLFTNDLPSSVSSGSVYMFADDTTVYCISDTAEKSIAKLNSFSVFGAESGKAY